MKVDAWHPSRGPMDIRDVHAMTQLPARRYHYKVTEVNA